MRVVEVEKKKVAVESRRAREWKQERKEKNSNAPFKRLSPLSPVPAFLRAELFAPAPRPSRRERRAERSGEGVGRR